MIFFTGGKSKRKFTYAKIAKKPGTNLGTAIAWCATKDSSGLVDGTISMGDTNIADYSKKLASLDFQRPLVVNNPETADFEAGGTYKVYLSYFYGTKTSTASKYTKGDPVFKDVKLIAPPEGEGGKKYGTRTNAKYLLYSPLIVLFSMIFLN